MENSQKASPSILSDMLCALKRFDEEAHGIVNGWLSELEKCPVPSVIYHYTTDVGLRGILESGKLWLTDLFYLNDPSELQHGVSIAMDLLHDHPIVCQELPQDFSGGLQEKRLQKIANFFVCSFSACGDDLGQWRAYADNGRGYALGFNTKSLEETFCANAKKKALDGTPISDGETFPVTYDDSKLVEIHRQIIERGQNLSQQAVNAHRAELLGRLATYVVHTSVYFKHRAYINENEYRFLEVHRADGQLEVKFRPRAYELIRYREFDWRNAGAGVLKKIVIGPAADKGKSREFAERCLHDSRCNDVEIVCSDIPYGPR